MPPDEPREPTFITARAACGKRELKANAPGVIDMTGADGTKQRLGHAVAVFAESGLEVVAPGCDLRN